ncbi:hypothetical protein ACK6V0_24280 [Citrobacter braakii]|uniref:hypothetical protein n=1 Tax=Citrobacter braakii TaxID=57706 RepID=UPI003C30B735
MIVLSMGMLVSGCKSTPEPGVINKKNTVVNSISGDNISDIARMENCRREIEALKAINTKIYQQRKKEFDAIVAGASVYIGVRGEINSQTQIAVDSYYKYKSEKLCADISSDVLNYLSKQI